MPETHDDVIREMQLPRVGDTVRSKKYGMLRQITEEKEFWLKTSADPETGGLPCDPGHLSLQLERPGRQATRIRQDARICLLPA